MIGIEQAQKLLAGIDGASFAGLDTLTFPKLKGGKQNPMQGKIMKICHGHRVMLFTNKKSSGYENKVKRHLEKAGLDPASFVMGALPWGERVPNSPFIKHNEQYYLQTVFLASGTVEYKATDRIFVGTKVYFKGDVIPKEDVIGLDDRTGSEGQGLERSEQVIVRAYKLDSILALRAMSEELTN